MSNIEFAIGANGQDLLELLIAFEGDDSYKPELTGKSYFDGSRLWHEIGGEGLEKCWATTAPVHCFEVAEDIADIESRIA